MIKFVVMIFKKLKCFVFPVKTQIIKICCGLLSCGRLTDVIDQGLGLFGNFILFIFPGIY